MNHSQTNFLFDALKTLLNSGGSVLFLICGTIALVSAIGTIAAKSPLRAAMSLLLHIVSLAGLYISLHAHLLGALQLIVYAGAVVVLFVFVIMLIGPTSDLHGTFRGLMVRICGAVLMILIGGTIAGQLMHVKGEHIYTALEPTGVVPSLSDRQMPAKEGETPSKVQIARIAGCAPGQGPECGQYGGVGALGSAIYKDDLVPFEIVSVLLLVAIIGAIAVARGRSAEEAAARKASRLAAEAADREQLAREKELSAQVAASGGH